MFAKTGHNLVTKLEGKSNKRFVSNSTAVERGECAAGDWEKKCQGLKE